jgi:hypothetical protein
MIEHATSGVQSRHESRPAFGRDRMIDLRTSKPEFPETTIGVE